MPMSHQKSGISATLQYIVHRGLNLLSRHDKKTKQLVFLFWSYGDLIRLSYFISSWRRSRDPLMRRSRVSPYRLKLSFDDSFGS